MGDHVFQNQCRTFFRTSLGITEALKSGESQVSVAWGFSAERNRVWGPCSHQCLEEPHMFPNARAKWWTRIVIFYWGVISFNGFLEATS